MELCYKWYTMKQKFWYWFCVPAIAFTIGVLLIYISIVLPREFDNRINLDWACMDGCYDMETLLLGKLDYSNSTQEAYHNECASVCHKRYGLE